MDYNYVNYIGVEEMVDILIREFNINEILHNKSYSNEDIINEINKKGFVLYKYNTNKLNNYINKKRGTN
tara:strand:- start:4906 stop:5112 length:207 start_codon:yes stop_codon:yes gene_type:complete